MLTAGNREDERYLVPAIAQAARVLFCLAEAESTYVSLTEVCEKLGIHKSRVFSILRTLQRFGFVQRNTEGRGYSLGPGLIGLSRRFLDNLSVPKLAEPLLEDLAKKSGATAALGLIADRNVFIAAKHEGGNPLGFTMRVGHRFPLLRLPRQSNRCSFRKRSSPSFSKTRSSIFT